MKTKFIQFCLTTVYAPINNAIVHYKDQWSMTFSF